MMLEDQIISHILTNLEISKITLRRVTDDFAMKKDNKTGEIYYDTRLRYYYMDTNEVVNAKKVGKIFSQSSKAERNIKEISLEKKTLRGLKLALYDFSPEIAYPTEDIVENLSSFLLSIANGEMDYSGERNPTDAVALKKREKVVLAMSEYFYWCSKRQYDLIPVKDQFSVNWRESRLAAFIHSYAKINDPSAEVCGSRRDDLSALAKGGDILRRARDGYEIPPSALALWLCMSPRDAFDTEEGRAEWDRLYKQCQEEEELRRSYEPDELLRNVCGKGGHGPYPENHWSSRIIKGEQDFLPATPYPQSLFQVVLPKLTPRRAGKE